MPPTWLPDILGPEYCWHKPIAATLLTKAPPIPRISSYFSRRLWGLVNEALSWFSFKYCRWMRTPYSNSCQALPFGLVLKWTERTRIEEVLAMQMARAAGMPVPKVIGYGEHPDDFCRISILMTRSPGLELGVYNSDEGLTYELDEPWMEELNRCFSAMRQWKNPFGEQQICSVTGTNIATYRVPRHSMGPFENEKAMHEYLLAPASSRSFPSESDFERALATAQHMSDLRHHIVFTHGDFKAHNILVSDDGHLTAILDWECAGWCPDYWEFTTAMRYIRGSWFYQIAAHLGGNGYMEEMECERALTNLTVDSYAGM